MNKIMPKGPEGQIWKKKEANNGIEAWVIKLYEGCEL